MRHPSEEWDGAGPETTTGARSVPRAPVRRRWSEEGDHPALARRQRPRNATDGSLHAAHGHRHVRARLEADHRSRRPGREPDMPTSERAKTPNPSSLCGRFRHPHHVSSRPRQRAREAYRSQVQPPRPSSWDTSRADWTKKSLGNMGELGKVDDAMSPMIHRKLRQ